MESILALLQHPFVWGLLLGLLIAGFIWKSGFTAKRHDAREIKRLESEMRDLQSHLNTQLKINASGNEALQTELESLRQQNENLRVNQSSLLQKPGKAEQRAFQIQELAISLMREQAPGFAPVWEKALRQAEAEMEATDSGLKRFVRKVLPGLGHSTAAAQPLTIEASSTNDSPASLP